MIPLPVKGTVIYITDAAFSGEAGLQEIVIPASVVEVGRNLWNETGGGGAFQNCTALTSVVFEGDNLSKINLNTFNGCSALSSIELPESLEKIEYNAFDDCSALKSIVIPDKVTYIGEGAFWGCSALITVSFEHESQLKIIQGSYEKIYVGHSPNGYNRYYRSGGFRGLANLTTFDASNCSQIESIEPSAFYHCSKLQSVKVGTMIPPTCGIDAFSELNSYTILTVPKESIEAYKQANEWKNFTNITALN